MQIVIIHKYQEYFIGHISAVKARIRLRQTSNSYLSIWYLSYLGEWQIGTYPLWNNKTKKWDKRQSTDIQEPTLTTNWTKVSYTVGINKMDMYTVGIYKMEITKKMTLRSGQSKLWKQKRLISKKTLECMLIYWKN